MTAIAIDARTGSSIPTSVRVRRSSAVAASGGGVVSQFQTVVPPVRTRSLAVMSRA